MYVGESVNRLHTAKLNGTDILISTPLRLYVVGKNWRKINRKIVLVSIVLVSIVLVLCYLAGVKKNPKGSL